MVQFFVDEHDFVRFPDLRNAELGTIGFVSPHKQIEEDFDAVVVRVRDGEMMVLRTDFRDFDFPLRFLSVDAPELNTGTPGQEAREYLANLIEGVEVIVKIDRFNRVEKFGRLLGDVVSGGLVVSESMVHAGHALPFDRRREGSIPQ